MQKLASTSESEREKSIQEISVNLIPLASIEDLTHGYWLYGFTKKGKYFEVHGYPSWLEVKLYENQESDNPIAEAEVDVTGDSEKDRRRLAETLYDMVKDEDPNDEITTVSIGG